MSKKTKLICTNIVCRNPNLNVILSMIAVVWIWRGTWVLSDILFFGPLILDWKNFYGYVVPLLVGLAYVYFNDFDLSEIGVGLPLENNIVTEENYEKNK